MGTLVLRSLCFSLSESSKRGSREAEQWQEAPSSISVSAQAWGPWTLEPEALGSEDLIALFYQLPTFLWCLLLLPPSQ